MKHDESASQSSSCFLIFETTSAWSRCYRPLLVDVDKIDRHRLHCCTVVRVTRGCLPVDLCIINSHRLRDARSQTRLTRAARQSKPLVLDCLALSGSDVFMPLLLRQQTALSARVATHGTTGALDLGQICRGIDAAVGFQLGQGCR